MGILHFHLQFVTEGFTLLAYMAQVKMLSIDDTPDEFPQEAHLQLQWLDTEARKIAQKASSEVAEEDLRKAMDSVDGNCDQEYAAYCTCKKGIYLVLFYTVQL